MTISELKKEARVKLSGKWLRAIIINLVYLIIVSVLESISQFINNNILTVIYSIVIMLVSLPFSYGLVASMIKLSRNEEVSILDFITLGLQSLKKVWSVFLNTFLRLILPLFLFLVAIVFFVITIFLSIFNSESSVLMLVSIILLIVTLIYYIVKALSYQLTSYILYDNPESTGKEIVLKSAELMKGNKWKYIGLGLSFIGWYLLIYAITFACVLVNEILSLVILFIGAIILLPYISITTINFYEDLNNDSTINQTETTSSTNE